MQSVFRSLSTVLVYTSYNVAVLGTSIDIRDGKTATKRAERCSCRG